MYVPDKKSMAHMFHSQNTNNLLFISIIKIYWFNLLTTIKFTNNQTTIKLSLI